jgi:hypothetical protein
MSRKLMKNVSTLPEKTSLLVPSISYIARQINLVPFQLIELEIEDQRRMGRKVISQVLYSSLLQIFFFVEVFSCS